MTTINETVGQVKVVEQLVIDYQQYEAGGMKQDFAVFNIMQAVKAFKTARVNALRRSVPKAICIADLYALFDDALLAAMDSYKPERGATFYTYLNAILEHKKANVIEQLNRKRSIPVGGTVSLSPEMAEVLTVDETGNYDDVMTALDSYSKISKGKANNAAIILIECDLLSEVLSKKDRIKALFNKEMTAEAVKKRLQRARADFKQYYQSQQSEGDC
ncbi:hypothetical protein [Enterococcus songbeiensis]|uniref:hypothetical protein n=1 Tax=Enterococcus songbeiensis TaxID=2559927 RepID=UPI0010F51B96|nr:hypothetical protein [Enterococcus songbeiensis]